MILSNRLFTLSVVIAILVFIYIVYLVINRRMMLRCSLVWIIAALGFLTIAVFPQLLRHITNLIGIGWPIHTLFFGGIIFLLIMLLIITNFISRNREAVKELCHEIAILKEMIEED